MGNCSSVKASLSLRIAVLWAFSKLVRRWKKMDNISFLPYFHSLNPEKLLNKEKSLLIPHQFSRYARLVEIKANLVQMIPLYYS